MAEITKKGADSASNDFNLAKWLSIAVIFCASMWANYHFVALATSLRLIAWIVIAILLLAIFLVTSQGKRFTIFAKAARNEMRKVVWPTRQETMQSTFAVAALVVILALLLWAIDSFWLWLITLITG